MTEVITPRFVILPEVEKWTDQIEIGPLGLPQGFDEGRLLLNVRRLQRILYNPAGLGRLTINSYEGPVTDNTPSVVGMSGSGLAFAGLSGAIKKRLYKKATLVTSTLSFLTYIGVLM